MAFSPQQDMALKAVSAWLRSPGRQQVFRLFGYAGTGKTTLAREFASGVDGYVLFGAFTGKAAHVLARKGCEGAQTIHSMIYRVEEQNVAWEPRFILDRDSAVKDAALVIIDEVSMVGEDLGRDLLSFGTPILVLGDPAQLPPVKGEGFFTDHEPDVMLTEVHRQAKDSPIIHLATRVREGERLEIGRYGDSVVMTSDGLSADQVLEADQVLVGKNATRVSFNNRIRQLKGLDGIYPHVGERLICLRNDRKKKLLNGSLWTVSDTMPRTKRLKAEGLMKLTVRPEEAPDGARGVDIKVKDAFWTGNEADLDWSEKKGTDEFTYGYALTCHKSQGSQWDHVLVYDQSGIFREDAWRWKYTAITRAAQKVKVIVP